MDIVFAGVVAVSFLLSTIGWLTYDPAKVHEPKPTVQQHVSAGEVESQEVTLIRSREEEPSEPSPGR